MRIGILRFSRQFRVSIRYGIFAFLMMLPFLSASKEKEPEVTELQELIVRPKRQKYKKKGNPAYELMQEIRKVAPSYDPTRKETYTYDFYEKILLGLNDLVVDKDSKHTGFLADYSTIAYNTGKPVILLSMKEKAGKENWIDGKKKTWILARTNAGVDDAFDQENINKMLEDVLRPIDIYSNDIALLQQRFVSPLGRLAGDYYHYTINDTVTFPGDEKKYVELVFAPVNPESFSFNGRFYVSDDSTRFIKKLSMRIPSAINLNYVDNIFVTQEFVQDSLGCRHLVSDDMALELRILPGTPSFYARRSLSRDHYTYDLIHPSEPLSLEDYIDIQETFSQNPSLMDPSLRLVPLSKAEESLSGIHDAMKRNPLFYWGEQIIMVVAKGYLLTEGNWKGFRKRNNIKRDGLSRFDFGPVNTLISYNSLEGVRLRIGGMTTGALSSHIFARGYAAWGFGDKRWKYELEGEYSFRSKRLHAREFPIHSLRLTHRYDVDMLGQHYLFTNADNVFLSLKRKKSNLDTYRRLSMLEYTLELENNFSVVAGICHSIQFATPFIPFVTGAGRSVPHYSQTSFFVKLRYAPGEVFYEGRTIRQPINLDAPVIQLTQEFGPKGFLGSAFTLNTTELSLQKRIWFSSFGFADVILKGGKIWSKVQFPALLWPNANLSYTIQPESYSLMNPLEFANDWYGSLDLTYWLNGLIFNRIPVINRLKLREIFTFKLLMGGLTNKNTPEHDESLFRFPKEGDMVTGTLGRKPYMEIGAGLDNILTILRVDYVWRLTYRNLPGISRSGLRVSLHFSF